MGKVVGIIILLWLLYSIGYTIVKAIIKFLKGSRRPAARPSEHNQYGERTRHSRGYVSESRSTSSTNTRRPKITFKNTNPPIGSSPSGAFSGLVDALTGVPLDPNQGLYQCRRCKVFYQPSSVTVIKSENGGKCVSCLDTSLMPISATTPITGANADVNVATLYSYRSFVGRVITFEGRVLKVLTSSRGTDYAVMFEDKTWIKGFKMVIFKGAVSRVGGPNFLRSLANHTITVRGLLIRHNKFGYEIVVSDRAMILLIQ